MALLLTPNITTTTTATTTSSSTTSTTSTSTSTTTTTTATTHCDYDDYYGLLRPGRKVSGLTLSSRWRQARPHRGNGQAKHSGREAAAQFAIAAWPALSRQWVLPSWPTRQLPISATGSQLHDRERWGGRVRRENRCKSCSSTRACISSV